MGKYFIFFIGFFVGVLGGALGAGIYLMGALLILAAVGCFWGKVQRKLAFLSVMAAILGILRFMIAEKEIDTSQFGREVIIRGLITDVDERSEYTRLTVEPEWPLVIVEMGDVLVKTKRYPVYEYGDQVEIKGKLKEPEIFDDFDYRNYLARYGIHATMSYSQVKLLKKGMGNSFYRLLFRVRNHFEGVLSSALPEPHASFTAGLLIGARRGIPEGVLADFQRTGLTHIIAISGYNITLLIVFVSGLFQFLRRRWQVILSIILIVVFTLFVGASAAVTRAAIMGVLGLLALSVGRKGEVVLLTFWSAFFMVLWNPLILVYDIGFQLSFLAVLGLILVLPRLEGYFKWLPEAGGFKEAFVTTLAAQVLVLPVILINFKQLSLISPLANVFVLPFIPLAMLFGFLLVIVSLMIPPLGFIFQAATFLILEVILFFVGIFARIPFAAVEISWFSWVLAGGYYLLVGKWLLESGEGARDI